MSPLADAMAVSEICNRWLGERAKSNTVSAPKAVKSPALKQAIAQPPLLRGALLEQNPHAVREPHDNVLKVAIGHEVRARRKMLGLTVADLATITDISIGMLSKIENGITAPSLTTLQALSRSLGLPLTALFRSFEEERSAVFVKAGEGVHVERRGTRAGHQYGLLGHIVSNTAGVTVEPYLITLSESSDVFPTFQHEVMEFLYMLEGEVVYRHGDHLYRMLPGDSLFFDADSPHGPEGLPRLPTRYLSIISYVQGTNGK